MTIPERFAGIVNRFPEREAVVSAPQRRRLTYAQLARAIDELASALIGLGFARGERIGVWSTNNVEWLLLQFATARIGAILVNINPANRTRELAHALARSEVQGLFAIPRFRASDYVGMLLEAAPALKKRGARLECAEFPHLRKVVVYDPHAPLQTERPADGFTTWQEAVAAGKAFSRDRLDELTAALDRDDPINIQYTSGTTGFPKAVVLTHHNILNNAYFVGEALRYTDRDRVCIPVPFYHCFGMVLGNLACTTHGSCMVIPSEAFDPLAVLETGPAPGTKLAAFEAVQQEAGLVQPKPGALIVTDGAAELFGAEMGFGK